MTNEEKERLPNEGMVEARKRAIARRALVGMHKYQISPDGSVVVNEDTPELAAFMYDKRVLFATSEGSRYVALMQDSFKLDVNLPQEIILGVTPNLPELPGGANWNMWRIPEFMESGNLVRLTIKATYNTGKFLNTMMFLLSKRHPVNDPNFTANDIIFNQLLILDPPQTGPGFGGDYTTWFDQVLNRPSNQAFVDIRQNTNVGGSMIGNSEVQSLYVLCENWQLAGPPAGDLMRVEIYIEDRGR